MSVLDISGRKFDNTPSENLIDQKTQIRLIQMAQAKNHRYSTKDLHLGLEPRTTQLVLTYTRIQFLSLLTKLGEIF